MRVRGLEATPTRTQTVHLTIGLFRPRFLLQINLSSFLQEWLAFHAGEEGVAGFLYLSPAGDAVSQGTWSGSHVGCGSPALGGGCRYGGDSDARATTWVLPPDWHSAVGL